MEIRIADQNDALKIAAVGACVFVHTYAQEGVCQDIARFVMSEFTESKIREQIAKNLVLAAARQGDIAGYIVVNPEKNAKNEIENLYILPGFHKQGLGKRLINEALQKTALPVWLSVWEENKNAIGFYRHLGFKQTGELFFDLYGVKIRNLVLELSR